ncbi:RNA polymerase sigma-70 factor (sigma-E family) [Allocatelliglobosispora scoriae]|uniref:RNA polymerase sigma-70 factor (Sigma-E family) n=1 Tax=Allocatelliglobosispora scoriae TaxID=643052 RepID=A0A841C0V2_9ACTN|nr:SigE family RNA polymerase sigma factor [Allocatelliglobosispora scoriae]MBB5874004.1 RNA polymerase sigma-70 factor (sigma-E family) [Allocatelliglobosispora scoriae]
MERGDFDEFVVQRSQRLLRTAYLLTRDWAAAEDLLQAALVKLWFAWKRVDRDPEAYARRIIVTSYISLRRRLWTREIVRGELPERAVPDEMHRHAERDALWQALRRLGPRQRAIIVLRYYEDLSDARIAEMLGVAVTTVRSQASRALAVLRKESELDNARERTLSGGRK